MMLFSLSGAGVLDFFGYNILKTGKIYQVTKNIPNGHKIYQMTLI
jgi:hypothetical protein